MTVPAPKPYVSLCPACNGQNPRCATCLGRQYVVVHPYALGRGEQGDDFADLIDRDAFDVARTGREQNEAGHA